MIKKLEFYSNQLLFVSFLLFICNSGIAQVCDCETYLYVNDPTYDLTHKFTLESNGAVGPEIGNTWLPPDVIINPHGVASDINGFLYVAQLDQPTDPANNQLFKLNCDGDVVDADFIPGWDATFNLVTIGNTIYRTNALDITAYDLCTKEVVASIDIRFNPDDVINWGLQLGLDGNLYATSSWGGLVGDQIVYRIDPELTTKTIVAQVPNSNPDLYTLGVTTDQYGNVYMADFHAITGHTTLRKFDSDGNLISSISDTNYDEVGFLGAWGIIYHEDSGKIYIGTLLEDCIAVVDAGGQNGNMVYEQALGIPHVPAAYSKAINLVKECCPVSNEIVVDKFFCGNQIGAVFFLQDLLDCDGTICEGEWQADTGNDGISYDPCSQRITILGANACGTFTLSSDGNGNNLQCGAYTITLNVEAIDLTAPVLGVDQVLCEDTNDPAEIEVLTAAIGNGNLSYQWQVSVENCTDGFEDIPGATNATYDPTSISQTSYYRLAVSASGNCASGQCEVLSNCVTVSYFPGIDVLTDPADVCTDNEDIILSYSPTGGVFTTNGGVAFSDNLDGSAVFDVSEAGTGNYDITYTLIDNELCTVSETVSFEIFEATPVNILSSGPYCIDVGIVQLLADQLGGLWSGDGIVDGAIGTFDPVVAGVGNHMISYTYNNENNCTSIENIIVIVQGLDFGDLPDANNSSDCDYPTQLVESGPSHCVSETPNIFLGLTVDVEMDGQSSDLASGDGDDEDGFNPDEYMFVRNQSVNISIPLVNNTDEEATLVAYFDWNKDSDFEDTNEKYSVSVPAEADAAIISNVTPPTDAILNKLLGVRFRISTDQLAVMQPTGPAPDGEVEDYLVSVMAFDWGDLPDQTNGTASGNYQTTNTDNGAVHKISTNDLDQVDLKIGNSVDDELDGQQSAEADGDGDDEDGFDPADYMFVAGEPLDLEISLMNMTGEDAKLTVFIDWDKDGDFDGVDEIYFADVAEGTNAAIISNVTPPFDAVLNMNLGMRVRLSTDMNASMSPTGLAPDGEVEDYQIMVMGFDYGDLIDASDSTNEQDYQTLEENNGPSHKLVTGDSNNIILKLGTSVDPESNGQQSLEADGDGEDEDSFNPNDYMFVRNQPIDISIPLMNMTGQSAKLVLFIDWNNDGDFDDLDEMYSTIVNDGDLEAMLIGVTPPTSTHINEDLGFRIRISTDMDSVMSPEGPAPDGEVEDYEIVVMAFDYGDLSDQGPGTGTADYETLIQSNGAIHKLSTDDNNMINLKLGSTVDDELEGQESELADGDGEDEDSFNPNDYMFVAGVPVNIDFPLMNMTGSNAKLTMFIDWNKDGDFEDFTEMYSVEVSDGALNATIENVTPPTNAILNMGLGFRVRLSTDMTASMSSVGLAPDGEVEDYVITVMGFDWGDLPDSSPSIGPLDYSTSSENNGPNHKVSTNENNQVTLKIGDSIDVEADGNESINANGDGDDELSFDFPIFVTGEPIDIEIPVMNMTGSEAKLTMFIDWNKDGDFDDDQEMLSQLVNEGDSYALFENVIAPLTSVLNMPLGLRLRISTDQLAVMQPTGPAPDGEVEDYLVTAVGYDFGDLPDSSTGTNGDPSNQETLADHQTLKSDGGPKHMILTNESNEVILKIGSSVDDDGDATVSPDAGITGGDDNTSADMNDEDDEDGLDLDNIPLFILTQTTLLEIPIMNMTGSEATMAAFIDFNKDGYFDSDLEKFTVTILHGATEAELEILVPSNAVVGQHVGLRLRLANEMNEVMSGDGCAASGEVEDYLIEIVGFDYGDLPDSFGTTGDEAPRHIVSENLKLGSCIDSELDGIPDGMAGSMSGGDDEDPGLVTFGTCNGTTDEDGLEFNHPLITGSSSCITVDAMNMTGSDAILQVWIDWNGDNAFNLDEELMFENNIVPQGGVSGLDYCFDVPADAIFNNGNAFVRARLSPEGGLSPDEQIGGVPFGEIEDYKVSIYQVGNLVWSDANGNGTQDEEISKGLGGAVLELTWCGPDDDPETIEDNVDYYRISSSEPEQLGKYDFTGLVEGEYYISMPYLPQGYNPTFRYACGDPDKDSDNKSGTPISIISTANIPNGENGTGDDPGNEGVPDSNDNLSLDFGFYQTAKIGDQVWYDSDKDNIIDFNENGINGLEVILYREDNCSGDFEEFTSMYSGHKPGTPSDDGWFEFCVPPGNYYLDFGSSFNGLVAAQPDFGSNDDVDSDIDNYNGPNTTQIFTVSNGEEILNIGAGFYLMASSGDIVWRDDNGNGQQDDFEPKIGGVKVEAYDNVGVKVGETVSNESGFYSIESLQQEAYYFKVVPPEGHSVTNANIGDDDMDSDIDGSNGPYTTRFFEMLSGEHLSNIDIGLAFGVVPVTYGFFKGINQNNFNLIEWGTESELSNHYFSIERKFEDDQFVEIAQVQGNGTSTQSRDYYINDFDIFRNGVYYYRLKQVDYNGNFDYSGVIAIKVQDNIVESSFHTYPNPCINLLNLDVALNVPSKVEVEIYKLDGTLIKKINLNDLQSLKQESYSLDFSDIATGLYKVRLITNTTIEQKTIFNLKE